MNYPYRGNRKGFANYRPYKDRNQDFRLRARAAFLIIIGGSYCMLGNQSVY